MFDEEVILDSRTLRRFVLRVGDSFAPRTSYRLDQQDGLDEEYRSLEDQGAGYRSIAGVMLTVLLSGDRIVLLDEPEAFLHPAQARDFGFWLGDHTKDSPSQMVVSTHNSYFVSGVLSADLNVRIFRLNRNGNITSYHLVPSEITSRFSSDPLLSNQSVVNSIFHKGVAGIV